MPPPDDLSLDCEYFLSEIDNLVNQLNNPDKWDSVLVMEELSDILRSFRSTLELYIIQEVD